VDEPRVADVDPGVAKPIEEDDVTRLERVARDRRSQAVLLRDTVPAEAWNLQSPRARSIMTPEEFDVFHRARAGLADYFHQCGSRRAGLPEFEQFLEHEVRANHYYRTKIVAYLEIALARARAADFPEASREHAGLFQLGRTWRVDDTRDEKPALPSTELPEKLHVRRRSA